MTRRLKIPLALLAAAALTACGDDPPQRAAVASADRYCALTQALEAAGEKHFARLGRDATPEQYEAAEREFVESQTATLDALQAAAPEEIAGDVRTLLAAQRARGGLPVDESVGRKAATTAEKRVLAYERGHC